MTVTAALDISFAINPALDISALARRFMQSGRIQIQDFLVPAAAEALQRDLLTNTRWRHMISASDKVFEAAVDDFHAMPADQRKALETAMFATAARGFQFQYDAIRVPDLEAERQRSGTLLDAFASFLSAADTRAILCKITGARDIVFADAQATRYRPGDFLTRHDDAVAGKNRVLAYVMGLSREWRAEWGGLLLFNGKGSDVIETIVPRFNALSLFTVPQPHSVSYVAPYAPEPRLSVTGWLRSAMP